MRDHPGQYPRGHGPWQMHRPTAARFACLIAQPGVARYVRSYRIVIGNGDVYIGNGDVY